jgi:UDP-N-acetylmuramoyl-L-alanyl-D-glutamate--2,6-diaminopimelate ligase
VTVPSDPTTYRETMNSTPRPHRLPDHSVRACAALLGAQVTGPDAALETAVTGITHDAQAVQPGDVYVAWPGAARHGAEFAGEARPRARWRS